MNFEVEVPQQLTSKHCGWVLIGDELPERRDESGMQQPLARVFGYQIVLLVVLLLGLGWWHPDGLKSALCGGFLFILPNAYFTYYAFRYRGARFMPWIVRSMQWGQSGKLMLTVVGFALVFRFVKPLDLMVLFGVYGVMVAAQIWIALVVTRRQSDKPKTTKAL